MIMLGSLLELLNKFLYVNRKFCLAGQVIAQDLVLLILHTVLDGEQVNLPGFSFPFFILYFIFLWFVR